MTTASQHPRRLIWFCSTESVAREPQTLQLLRDEIGLTTIMPESGVCHTSGFAASPELAARGPFEDWRQRQERWPRAADGIYPPVAGTVGGFDDGDLLRVIEAARAAGIEVWGHLGLWSYGGDVYPELSLQDSSGHSLGESASRWGIGLCPSRREVNEWTRDCLVDVAGRYDIDGFCVDHARYPAPASVASLGACACSHCRRESEALGYDFDAMMEGLSRLHSALRGADGAALLRRATEIADLWQFVASLIGDDALERWAHSRAALLAARMREFGQAVRGVSPDLVFGSDVFAPSIALLGGQNYGDWEEVTDYLTGGSSAGGVVGWATSVTNVAGEWGALLSRHVAGMSDTMALELVFALFGYGDLDLPATPGGLESGPLPVARLYERELSRLMERSSGRVPRYPPISAHGDIERVTQLCRAVVDAGCDGAMLGLDPANADILKVLKEELGRP